MLPLCFDELCASGYTFNGTRRSKSYSALERRRWNSEFDVGIDIPMLNPIQRWNSALEFGIRRWNSHSNAHSNAKPNLALEEQIGVGIGVGITNLR